MEAQEVSEIKGEICYGQVAGYDKKDMGLIVCYEDLGDRVRASKLVTTECQHCGHSETKSVPMEYDKKDILIITTF